MTTLNTTNATNESCYYPYDSKFIAVAAVSAASNFISLLANCLVLFFIILFKRWSFFNQRLILYLSLATIVNNVAGILATVDYDNHIEDSYSKSFCMFAGFLLQMTDWMITNAYICITTSLLIKAYFTINLEKLDIVTILFIFASPVILNWIPFTVKAYGQSGGWCWIRSLDRSTCRGYLPGEVLQLILFYIPVYLIVGVLIVIYSVVMVNFCHRRRKWKLDPEVYSQNKQALRYTISLLAYPIIYFVTNIFPFINRLQGIAHRWNPSLALWFLSAIFHPQQGVGVAIAFLLSIQGKLNRVSIKAAFAERFHKVEIMEYPFINNTKEKSESVEYHTF